MASTTAEVLLYYGTDDDNFKATVDYLRFSRSPEMTAREIIDIINPIWRFAREQGYDAALDPEW